MDKELKKMLKEAQKKIVSEYTAKKRFIDSKLDYNYLQQMINNCDCDDNLEIVINMTDGTQIVIHKKHSGDSKFPYYDDRISPEDIR